MSGAQEKPGDDSQAASADDQAAQPRPEGQLPTGQTDRRQRLHEANNRLAAVIMNLAFARATLAACAPDAQLTALERADLAIALDHAEDAATRLASVIRELG